MIEFKSELVWHSDQIFPAILKSLAQSPFFMGQKLTFVKQMVGYIRQKYVDELVDIFTGIAGSADQVNGILVCNVNPYIVTMQFLDISAEIKKACPLSRIPLDQFDDDVTALLITLLTADVDQKSVAKMVKVTNL